MQTKEYSKNYYRQNRERIAKRDKVRSQIPEVKLRSMWQGMLDRCRNPDHKYFSHYGGRGIKVCSEWEDFPVFYEWARASGWEMHLTIDRIDNDSGYHPENCRFVTKAENSRNRSSCILDWPTVKILRARYSGKWGEATKLANEIGISPGLASAVLKNKRWHDPDYDPPNK